MISAGIYRARPVEAVLGMTQSGKEQIAVRFALVEPSGTRITWYGFFTDKTWERTVEALRFCGWTGNDLSEFQFGQSLPRGFDKEVELVIEEELDQEQRPRNVVRWVNSGAGLSTKNALDAVQAKSFAARMRALILTHDQKNGVKAPAGDPAQESASEIPF